MMTLRPRPDWLPVRPFWRDLGAAGRKVIALDVPQAYAPEPFDGVELSGFASHDALAPPGAWPAELGEAIRRQFGAPPRRPEVHGLQSAPALLRLRAELLEATSGLGALAERLMRERPWDLFLVVFGAVHRGGHKLWDASNVRGEPDAAEAEKLEGALRDVYVACDRALGRLIEIAGADVSVLVFSVHGMGPNTSRTAILPLLLERILDCGNGAGPSPRRAKAALSALRERVPDAWRGPLKRQLPVAVQDRLSTFWRLNGIDWSSTAAISLIADLHGYIRINRRGREALGIVEPGHGFDALCRRIAAGLESFVDAETGAPVVSQVLRAEEALAPGLRSSALPDLLVRWSETPACRHRVLHSPKLGSVPWPVPGRHPDGRSGNHRGQGFLLGAGQACRERPSRAKRTSPTSPRPCAPCSGCRPIRPWSADR
jgi:predicted AlkP superfamily phosphohydrolase/phosphomutase